MKKAIAAHALFDKTMRLGYNKSVKRSAVALALSVLVAAACAASAVFAGAIAADTDGGQYVTYVLQDNFAGHNPGNWTVFQQPYLTEVHPIRYEDTVTFSPGINFTNDYASQTYEGARVISNVEFVKDAGRADADKYTVFETSFNVYQNNKENRRKDISYGLIFGLPEKDAASSEGNYFEFTSFEFALYRNGTRLEPTYLTENKSNAFGGYLDFDNRLEARLVANSAGELYCYFGFSDGKQIKDAYCKYEGLDMEGFLGFTGTSRVPERTPFSVSFDSIYLSGVTLQDNNFVVCSAAVDASEFTGAVVSDKPIPLKSTVVASPNLPAYQRAVYSVVSGPAEIREGNLYVRGAGEIVVRVASYFDRSKYRDYKFSAIELEISSMRFANDFSGITVYTQPFRLIARMELNSYVNKHSQVRFEVVSGPAEIYCDKYLKITGAGRVIVRATSIYLEDKFVTASFVVTDPDADYIPV